MPIVYIKDIDKAVRLGLWKIGKLQHSDTVNGLYTCHGIQSKCSAREAERIAVNVLLHEMTCREDFSIGHEASGKPFISIGNLIVDCNIGISHTKGFASIILSESHAVAVDIEYRSERVKRIADRFLRAEELKNIKGYEGDQLQTILLLHWCAKETIFKLYSDPRLTFQNMCVDNIHEICENGRFICRNLINGDIQTIQYEQNKNFVITYCIAASGH